MKKLKKIKDYLDKEFGEPNNVELKKAVNHLKKIIDKLEKIEAQETLNVDNNVKLKKAVNNLEKEITDKLEKIETQEALKPKDLSYIENAIQLLIDKKYPKPYKKVKVENLDEIKLPKPKDRVEVKDIDKHSKTLANRLIEGFRDVGERIVKQGEKIFVTNKKENDYIPVRVVYKDGRRVSFDPPWGGGSGGGGPSTVTVDKIESDTSKDKAKRIDDTTENVIYVGTADIGSTTSSAVWKIKKIDSSSGYVITWADGNADYDNVWDNRASLSYS
jgi:hypothetical protein